MNGTIETHEELLKELTRIICEEYKNWKGEEVLKSVINGDASKIYYKNKEIVSIQKQKGEKILRIRTKSGEIHFDPNLGSHLDLRKIFINISQDINESIKRIVEETQESKEERKKIMDFKQGIKKFTQNDVINLVLKTFNERNPKDFQKITKDIQEDNIKLYYKDQEVFFIKDFTNVEKFDVYKERFDIRIGRFHSILEKEINWDYAIGRLVSEIEKVIKIINGGQDSETILRRVYERLSKKDTNEDITMEFQEDFAILRYKETILLRIIERNRGEILYIWTEDKKEKYLANTSWDTIIFNLVKELKRTIKEIKEEEEENEKPIIKKKVLQKEDFQRCQKEIIELTEMFKTLPEDSKDEKIQWLRESYFNRIKKLMILLWGNKGRN